MYVQKQLVHINLTGGLQKKDGDKLVLPTKLVTADNVEFGESSTVRKREGQLRANAAGGTVPAVRMFTHKGVPIIETTDGVHTAHRTASASASVAAAPAQRVRLGALTRRVQGLQLGGSATPYSRSRRGFDVAVGGGEYFLTWEEELGGVMRVIYAIRDLASDAVISSGVLTTALDYSARPRVIYDSSNQRYALFWASYDAAATAFTVYATVIARTGSVVVSSTALLLVDDGVNNVESNALYEALFDASYVAGGEFVVAARGTSGDVHARMTNATLSMLGAINTFTPSSQIYALTTHATISAGVTTGHVFYSTGANYRARTLPSSTDVISGENSLGAVSGADFLARATVITSGASLYVLVDATEGIMNPLGQGLFKISPTHTVEDYIFIPSKCVIAAKMFTLDSRIYAPMLFDSNAFQRVLLVADISSTIERMDTGLTEVSPVFAARIAPGEVGAYADDTGARPYLTANPHIRVPGATSGFIPFLKYDGNARLAGGADVTPVAVNRVALERSSQLNEEVYNGLTYLAGAQPMIFDGSYMAEEGFHWAPEYANTTNQPVTVDALPGTGLYEFPEAGTYSIAFTEAWEDSNGNWHESGVSQVYQHTARETLTLLVDGGTAAFTVGELVTGGAGGTGTIFAITATGGDYGAGTGTATLVLVGASGTFTNNLTVTSAGGAAVQDGAGVAGALTGLADYVRRPPSLKYGSQLLLYRSLVDSTDTTLYLAHKTKLGPGITMPELDLPSSEILYTEGGVLPNNPLPACRHLATFQKRLVASGVDSGDMVLWSKQNYPGFAAEFVTTDVSFQLRVPAALGKVVGSVEMDDKLFILCERGIGAIYGQGPAPTGTQGQYSDFTTQVTELGAVWNSPKAIIRGPEGVWFRSPEGIRLFGRGGSILRTEDGKQVGAEVDAYTRGSTIVAVSGHPKQQLRFYLPASVVVWDYQWQRWTRYTGAASIDASGGYHLSNINGIQPLLRYFSSATASDVADNGTAPTAYTPTITTGWLSMAGIQGFQRVYRLMLLGEDPDGTDDQAITGSFSFDFLPAVGDSFSATVTPASNGTFQVQHHMSRQKCEAVQITLTFGNSNVGGTDFAKLVDLTLQVGLKPGYYKMPSAKRV